MATLQETGQRIKNWGGDAIGEWGLVAIVFLVGLASFGLGRLSALEDAKPAVSIQEASSEARPRGMHLGGLVIASRKGSTYQYPWCSGAETIAAQNRIWFPSEEKARAAGYRPAKNCKGLGISGSQ